MFFFFQALVQPSNLSSFLYFLALEKLSVSLHQSQAVGMSVTQSEQKELQVQSNGRLNPIQGPALESQGSWCYLGHNVSGSLAAYRSQSCLLTAVQILIHPSAKGLLHLRIPPAVQQRTGFLCRFGLVVSYEHKHLSKEPLNYIMYICLLFLHRLDTDT